MLTTEAKILNLYQKNTAQSFVLNLVPFKQEKITIKVFGSTEMKVQNIDVVKFIVIGASKNDYVETLVIPTTCSNLHNQYSNSATSNNYSHLKMYGNDWKYNKRKTK